MNEVMKMRMMHAFDDFLTQVYPDKNKAIICFRSKYYSGNYKLEIKIDKI